MPLKTFWSGESASIQIEDITEEPESKLADFLRRILSLRRIFWPSGKTLYNKQPKTQITS